jgi:hypothetical protein
VKIEHKEIRRKKRPKLHELSKENLLHIRNDDQRMGGKGVKRRNHREDVDDFSEDTDQKLAITEIFGGFGSGLEGVPNIFGRKRFDDRKVKIMGGPARKERKTGKQSEIIKPVSRCEIKFRILGGFSIRPNRNFPFPLLGSTCK